MSDNTNTQAISDVDQPVLKKSLDVICGKWRLYIIYQLSEQDRRYGELRRMIPDVSEKILIQELKALVTLGVVRKTSFSEVPPRVEYGLTEKTRKILPILKQIMEIGEAFLVA
ncbi:MULTISPECIES: winged helix-turn-helix transcriptional regulator [Spirosoma]|uniref:Helix-turn-helix transcriptional regulator n=1 Tax=Spirosoma liriopis TaxID=2937440 RepID=A0ABT0HF39_9BACT|nr:MULTISPECIES: helix-turn-helix domain-containing protein [Spirosoma]MCK8490782.1 helix-turn-helix transcriptional regulator [Spirosoma liriopis]UHG90168.1 helix-turn-helix transcriptional regulator [Spirosoma oryzicola]